MITRLKDLHERGYVHRDLKPHNFVIGQEDPNKIYMIDYGLAKRYYDLKTKQHISLQSYSRVVGTARYISLRCHYGQESSRRDDMESLIYMLIHFATGTLPWRNSGKIDRRMLEKIKNLKKNLKLSDICQGCPKEFQKFLKMVRNMGFRDTPDYNRLSKLLKNVIYKIKGKKEVIELDWIRHENKLPKKYSSSVKPRKKAKRHHSARKSLKYPKLIT